MKRLLAASFLALAACAPAPLSEPEATIEKIYKPLTDSKGDKGTDVATIPMTMDLALKIQEVESKADGPVFDWDLAGNCQDCTGFSDLKLTPAKTPAATADHKTVEANFKVFEGKAAPAVFWDMVKVAEGWQVDNIRSDEMDLRKVVGEQMAAQDAASQAEGDEAVECLAYLGLEAEAMKKTKPPGDPALFDQAATAWRTKAGSLMTADELAQYFASSLAVLDDTPAAELTAKATACAAKTPK